MSQISFASAHELLAASNLNFSCEQWPLYATNGERRNVVESHVANVRADTGATLGIVGKGYKVVQPADMADLADALIEQDNTLALDSCVASADGCKLVLKLRGGDFGPTLKDGLQDTLRTQLLLVNGFDGLTSFRVVPSTLRLFCTNQLHMLSEAKRGPAGVTLRHTRNVQQRIDTAKHVLAAYQCSLAHTRELIAKLGNAEADMWMADRFFKDAYERDFHPIPSREEAEENSLAAKARERAIVAFRAFKVRLDSETGKWGWSLWSVLNAYTGYVQHDNPPRVKDAAKRAEQITQSNLLGLNVERSMRAFDVALALVA